MRVLEIRSKEEKKEIGRKILKDLPEWFGDKEAVEDYVKNSSCYPFFAVEIKGEEVGFLSLKVHNKYSVEIYVLGVLQEEHKKGAGTALVNHGKEWAKERKFEYLHVKTLDSSVEDPFYEKTRCFYEKVGFRPLECIVEVWGSKNPCLIMVQSLE